MPPIGELKPAEIAAATPHPIKMSFDNSLGTFLFMRFPIVPPRCTNGPYCPTDAPPLAEMKAENVDKKPVLASSSLVGLCALKITSAGPWYREIFNILFTNNIVIAAKNKKAMGVKLKQKVDISSKHLLFNTLKSDIFFTPITKETETIETILPVRVPKIITCKIKLKIFKTWIYKVFLKVVYRMFKNCQIWKKVPQ